MDKTTLHECCLEEKCCYFRSKLVITTICFTWILPRIYAQDCWRESAGKGEKEMGEWRMATTTRGEKKTVVVGVQYTGDEEHEPRSEAWSRIVERIVINSILKYKYMLNEGLISAAINVQLISSQKKCFIIPMYDICVHGNGCLNCICMCSTVLRILAIGSAGGVQMGTILWNELKGEFGGKILVKGETI